MSLQNSAYSKDNLPKNFGNMSFTFGKLSMTQVISLPGVPIAAEATKLILLTVQLVLNKYKYFMRREVYKHRLRETLFKQ